MSRIPKTTDLKGCFKCMYYKDVSADDNTSFKNSLGIGLLVPRWQISIEYWLQTKGRGSNNIPKRRQRQTISRVLLRKQNGCVYEVRESCDLYKRIDFFFYFERHT